MAETPSAKPAPKAASKPRAKPKTKPKSKRVKQAEGDKRVTALAETQRSLARACITKRQRIRFIAELMADGLWVTGITIHQLAELWSRHVDTVKKDAAEASRSFELTDEERATRKSRFLAKIESAQGAARRMRRPEAEARFLELEAKVLGLFEPEKVELSGSLGDLLTLGLGPGGEEPDPPVGS